MRVSPHMPSEVLQQRQEYDAALRDAWETNAEAAASEEEPPRPGTPEIASMLARATATGPGSSHPRSWGHRAEIDPPERSADTIAVYPAGADPDRFRGKRAAYVSRSQVERLIQGKADLVRPIAYLIDDEDLERLRRRPSYPETRPTFAVVSRPLPSSSTRARRTRSASRAASSSATARGTAASSWCWSPPAIAGSRGSRPATPTRSKTWWLDKWWPSAGSRCERRGREPIRHHRWWA